MTTTHNLGFPRIGARRELKFALESYWKGESDRDTLKAAGAALRRRHWADQAGLDLVPVGDFAFYDQVLDMSFTLGNLPGRVRGFDGDPLDNYFRVARGRATEAAHDGCCGAVAAGELTKWFDTNYHYIVPEFEASTTFTLDPSRLLEQLAEARAQGVNAKPVIIGPLTYLALGKARDGSDRLALLPKLLPAYAELLSALAGEGVEWVQVDEPILVTELDGAWQQAFETAYAALDTGRVRLLLATYFGRLEENLPLLARLPVQGVHLDAVNARDEAEALVAQLPPDSVVSLGFGKSAPGHATPTLYLSGKVGGQGGLFRSLDDGASWQRINDDAHQYGEVGYVTGDPRVFGRVYVGTGGRGIFRGEPAGEHP